MCWVSQEKPNYGFVAMQNVVAVLYHVGIHVGGSKNLGMWGHSCLGYGDMVEPKTSFCR